MAMSLAQTPASEEASRLHADLHGLRQQVAGLERQLMEQGQRLEGMRSDASETKTELAELRKAMLDPTALPFMAAPPESSATAGVGKTVVFSPKVEADPVRRRDSVTLTVRRMESSGLRTVGEATLSGENSVGIPLDRSGALYVVEWSTVDGQTFDLLLRDGLTGQVAATVQVRPLQSQGRFLFVGY
jgi:hypothetical protein